VLGGALRTTDFCGLQLWNNICFETNGFFQNFCFESTFLGFPAASAPNANRDKTMSAALRTLMRSRTAVARAARQAAVPVFSVQARHMSIPRPTWDKPLPELDPEVYKIIQQEQSRQHKGIALIPSENYTTHAVSQVAARSLVTCRRRRPAGGPVLPARRAATWTRARVADRPCRAPRAARARAPPSRRSAP